MRILLFFILFIVSCTSIPEETGDPITVAFCPVDDCRSFIAEHLRTSSSKSCAFYDVDDAELHPLLTDARIVSDSDNKITGLSIHYDNRKAFMHNKFCVLDDGVLTGSYNPTSSGVDDYNNIVFIPSSYALKAYASEFAELEKGIFGKGAKTRQPQVIYNGHPLSVLFCPEDPCEKTVKETLLRAEKSIRFLTFSFTDDELARALIEKYRAGVDVRGIGEGQRQNMQYEQYQKLQSAGIPLALENTGKLVHHKVFIVDGTTVITGSANPTSAGYSKNDENIVVIENPELAQKYLMEFERLWNIVD